VGHIISQLPGVPATQRVALLAEWIVTNRHIDQSTWRNFTAMMCWDAVFLCAAQAGGVRIPGFDPRSGSRMPSVVTPLRYDHVFDPVNAINSANELRELSRGSLIGFVGPEHNTAGNRLVLRHVMIYTGRGRGIGTKNNCIYAAGSANGWESLDMTTFFAPGADAARNPGTIMVWFEVSGQPVF